MRFSPRRSRGTGRRRKSIRLSTRTNSCSPDRRERSSKTRRTGLRASAVATSASATRSVVPPPRPSALPSRAVPAEVAVQGEPVATGVLRLGQQALHMGAVGGCQPARRPHRARVAFEQQEVKGGSLAWPGDARARAVLDQAAEGHIYATTSGSDIRLCSLRSYTPPTPTRPFVRTSGPCGTPSMPIASRRSVQPVICGQRFVIRSRAIRGSRHQPSSAQHARNCAGTGDGRACQPRRPGQH